MKKQSIKLDMNYIGGRSLAEQKMMNKVAGYTKPMRRRRRAGLNFTEFTFSSQASSLRNILSQLLFSPINGECFKFFMRFQVQWICSSYRK